MKKALVYGFLFLFIRVYAQPPGKFSVVYGGSGDDVAYEIRQTLDGNFILVGSSSSAGNGQTDVYLLKIDSLGQKLWERYLGGAGSDVGRSVSLLSDSGFVITGFTSSFGNGGYDLYILRTDKTGNVLWQRTIGGNDWDFGYSAALTANSEIIATGLSYANGNQDVLLVKLDTLGTTLWEKHIGWAQDDAAKSIFTPDSSNFFIVGSTKSRGDLNGDVLLLKCNANGDTLFSRTYGHNGSDYGNSITTAPAGQILIAAAITLSNGAKDAGIIQTDAAGQVLWEKTYGLTSEDKEMYCILNSTSPVLASQVALFSSSEIQGNGKDAKTIYINSGGDYFGGWFSGTFGYLEDDEIYFMSACRDKGYISCGYTKSFSQSGSNLDILIIRRDSVLNYGVSITNDQEISFYPDEGIQVYPNPVASGHLELHYSVPPFTPKPREIFLNDMRSGRIEVNWNYEEQRLMVENIPAGMYVIRMITDKGVWVGKLLVE